MKQESEQNARGLGEEMFGNKQDIISHSFSEKKTSLAVLNESKHWERDGNDAKYFSFMQADIICG